MPNQQILRDEVSLLHFIRVFKKKKILVFVIFFLWTMGALFFYYKSPVIYQAHSVLRLGSFTKPVMTVPYAIQAMQEQKILADAVATGKLSVDINTLKKMFDSGNIRVQNIPDTQFLKVIVRSGDYQSASKICMAISEAFVAQGNQIFEKRMQFTKNQIDKIEDKQNSLNRVYMGQGVTSNLISLNEELLNAENFEVTDFPSGEGFPDRTVSRQKLAFIIIAGFIFSVLFAFTHDFVSNLSFE
jgi:hypothetical protein